MVKKVIILFMIITLFNACFPIIYGDLLDQKLKLERQDYKENEIRLDGFYYTEYYKDHYEIVFLYSSGIFIEYAQDIVIMIF